MVLWSRSTLSTAFCIPSDSPQINKSLPRIIVCSGKQTFLPQAHHLARNQGLLTESALCLSASTWQPNRIKASSQEYQSCDLVRETRLSDKAGLMMRKTKNAFSKGYSAELGIQKSCASHAQTHPMEALYVRFFGCEASLGCGDEHQDLESTGPRRIHSCAQSHTPWSMQSWARAQRLKERERERERESFLMALPLAIINNIAVRPPGKSAQHTHNQRVAGKKGRRLLTKPTL